MDTSRTVASLIASDIQGSENYQQEEIAAIALKVCTAVLLEFMKDRIDHGETF
jgi:hypothetical protein